jgi:hypothetical protein
VPFDEAVEHVVDAPCGCIDCQRLDVMWGDSRLTPWERGFVQSLCDWGWRAGYTERQRHVLAQVFARARVRWCAVR